MILLMEEILHQLGCIEPCESADPLLSGGARLGVCPALVVPSVTFGTFPEAFLQVIPSIDFPSAFRLCFARFGPQSF